MRYALKRLALLTALFAPAVAWADQDKCYAWSDAAPIVMREKLTSARDVHQQARERLSGELIRITLCERRGEFVYRLVVQEGNRVRNLTVDARKPF